MQGSERVAEDWASVELDLNVQHCSAALARARCDHLNGNALSYEIIGVGMTKAMKNKVRPQVGLLDCAQTRCCADVTAWQA